MRSTTWRELVLVLALAGLSVGCDRNKPVPPLEGPPPAASAPATATPRPALTGLPPGPWERAQRRDELALLRLAEMGAPELVRVAVSGHAAAPIAIEALGHAPDADLAFAELARLAVKDAERRRPALLALRAIATRRPEPVEPLDPEGVMAGAELLDRLSRDASVAEAERALAVSALRGLARAGRFDASRITTALDP